jgi:hypothetical protein
MPDSPRLTSSSIHYIQQGRPRLSLPSSHMIYQTLASGHRRTDSLTQSLSSTILHKKRVCVPDTGLRCGAVAAAAAVILSIGVGLYKTEIISEEPAVIICDEHLLFKEMRALSAGIHPLRFAIIQAGKEGG